MFVLLLPGSLFAQGEWIAGFVGAGRSSYETSSTVSVASGCCDGLVGLRYIREVGDVLSIELDLSWHRRSAELDLYLPFSNKEYLLSTTRSQYTSISFGLGLSGKVATWSSFSLRWLAGGLVSGPYTANFDVLAPSGYGVQFKTKGDGQRGVLLRSGVRVTKELGPDFSGYIEGVPFLVIKDEYRWSNQRGTPLQPTTPERWWGYSLCLGVQLRL